MKGKIIVFRLLKRVGHVRVNQFCRRFYGYLDRSNRGRYSYRRPGFIEGFPHVKIIRGVVLVKTEDAEKVTDFLKGFDAEIYSWTVELRPGDEKVLAKFKPKGPRPTGDFSTLL